MTVYDQGPEVSMFGTVPGLKVISSYRRRWLLKDVIAGVVLATLLVPQGMAYAELAGLYTSIMCLLGYAVAGPSRILVLGPDSSLGPMIAAVGRQGCSYSDTGGGANGCPAHSPELFN